MGLPESWKVIEEWIDNSRNVIKSEKKTKRSVEEEKFGHSPLKLLLLLPRSPILGFV
jgi:hypothetical protein